MTGGQLAAAAHSAFTTAMGTGMRVAAVVALLAAIGAAFALPGRGRRVPRPSPSQTARPGARTASPARNRAQGQPPRVVHRPEGAGPELAATTVPTPPGRLTRPG